MATQPIGREGTVVGQRVSREVVVVGPRERKDPLAKVKSFFSAVASIAEPYFVHWNLDYLESSYRANLPAHEKSVTDGILMGINNY